MLSIITTSIIVVFFIASCALTIKLPFLMMFCVSMGVMCLILASIELLIFSKFSDVWEKTTKGSMLLDTIILFITGLFCIIGAILCGKLI